MQVTVQLFARARDLAGADIVKVDVADGGTVGDLRKCLSKSYPKLSNLLQHSALAVDNEYAADSLPLPAGAEVALLPPVSGG
jgi:molybdopterin converting factor subunit 1